MTPQAGGFKRLRVAILSGVLLLVAATTCQPLLPQQTAELMAGRRVLAPDKWQQATSLDEVVIGAVTAAEIRWPQHVR